eukprot:SAG22_NODE_1145_length_5374_cov_15.659526_4_plen_193_part_00
MSTTATPRPNKAEHLQLFAEHRLLGAIRPQVEAFRAGFQVFVTPELLAQLRQCCTVAELQLLVCGTPEIDLADWRAHTVYGHGYTADSPVVSWFWAAVEEMDAEQRGQLLHFCTGSTRVPATGFANLQGYHGSLHPFELRRDARGPGALPTASTCFNTLRLPVYGTEAQLRAKLTLALLYRGDGFDEGAVAT